MKPPAPPHVIGTYHLAGCTCTVPDTTEMGFDYKIWNFWGLDVCFLEQHETTCITQS